MLADLTFMLESIIKGGRTYRPMGVQRLAREASLIPINHQQLHAAVPSLTL